MKTLKPKLSIEHLRRAYGAALVLSLAGMTGPVFSATITLLPEGNGTSTQWTTSGAGSNWEAIVTDDGDSSYVFTSARYDTDRYQMEDLPSPGTVTEVRAYFRARRTSNPAGELSYGINTGGSDYTASASLTTGYVLCQASWVQNPNTGTAWTPGDVNALQAVIVHDQKQSREHRVTQVYLEVDFISAVPTPTPTPSMTPTLSPTPTPPGYRTPTPVPTPGSTPETTPPPDILDVLLNTSKPASLQTGGKLDFKVSGA